jgi:hypothetical protein
MAQLPIAYAAGLLDGEGSILIERRGRYHLLRLKITMTNEAVLKAMKASFGGHLFGPYKHSGIIHHLPTWEWTIIGRAARDFLIEVQPLLIVKQEEAHIALDFARALYWKGNRNQWNPITEEEITDREIWRFALLGQRRGLSG